MLAPRVRCGRVDADLRHSMLRYYDERAREYEDAYVLGTGTASIPDPQVFQAEVPPLARIVERFGHGRLIDLACGTAYWLPYYVDHCASITLFDQSERMLDECRKKAAALNVVDRCSLVRGDFFDHDFGQGTYDSALIGFFVSHLTDAQERFLFDTLKRLLSPSGRFLILDSAWSPERARWNAKVGHQERRLNDGTRFEIYKRYCDQQDVSGWAVKYDMNLSIEHWGTAFYAVSGTFSIMR